VVVDPERCEACGQCIDGCSLHGITTRERLTGYILHGRMNGNMITVGKADDGHDFLVPLICALNRHEHPGSLSICDLGPGVSGYVQTALRDSSFSIIVQRPARGWLRNVQFLVDALKEKEIPFGLLINKFRGEEGFVKEAEEFCTKAKSPLLGIIPDFHEWKDQKYVDSNQLSSEMDSIFAGILDRVIARIPTSAELN
jgi:MinD superfamily P-loop ATPase